MQKCLFENFTVLNKSLKVGSGLALENGELEQISSNATLSDDCYLLALLGEELSDVCERYLSTSSGTSGLTGNQREYFLVEMFKSVVLNVDQNTKARIISVNKDDLIRHINENFFLQNSIFKGCSVVTSADGRKSFDLKEDEIVPFFRKTVEFKVPNIPGLDANVGLVEYLKYIVANAYIQASTPKDSVKVLFSYVESGKYSIAILSRSFSKRYHWKCHKNSWKIWCSIVSLKLEYSMPTLTMKLWLHTIRALISTSI